MAENKKQQVASAARQIAGALYDDAQGTTSERIAACLEHKNLGTDGDLTDADRAALRTLLSDLESK